MSKEQQTKDMQALNRNLGRGLKSLALWDLHHRQQQSQLQEIGNRVCGGCE